MADDPSLPYGPDTITTRFSMRVAVTFRRIRGRPGGNAQVERSTGDVASEQMVLLPPMSAEAERRFCAWLAANATPEPARRTAPEPWSALTKVYGNPNLGISGAADDEMTLWRRRTDKAEPEPLAALRLHLVGSEPSELYAGQRFAGLLWQAPDRALLHPEWLRDIGAVGPEPDEQNPGEPPLEEHPEPLQVFPPRPQTPAEMERHHGPPVPLPLQGIMGVPSGRPAAPAPDNARGPRAPGPAAGPHLFPYGFASSDAFARFGRQLRAGLEAAGYPDVYAAMRGSSVTGQNYRTGAPFDAGRQSDFDIALASPSLFQRGKELGIELRSGGHRTRPLQDHDLRALGLFGWANELRRGVDRPVSIMIYDSPEAIGQRGPNMRIPR